MTLAVFELLSAMLVWIMLKWAAKLMNHQVDPEKILTEMKSFPTKKAAFHPQL